MGKKRKTSAADAAEEQEAPGIPVRISMKSRQRETKAHLFEEVFGDEEGTGGRNDGLTRLSEAEEMMMGILPDADADGDPASREAGGTPSAETKNKAAEDSGIELITEGRMTCQEDEKTGDRLYAITYAESELTGMEGSQSSILFRTDDPGLVHLIRTGSVSTALTFREHCRAICAYNTPYMPFQVGVHSLLVSNRLLDDGTLTLEYIIEIRGAQAERCRIDLKVTPQAAEEGSTD